MSSPFGHSLAGLLLYSGQGRTPDTRGYVTAAVCACIANVPDLDFIPGILLGTPNLYHHGISHSLGAAVIFSLLLFLVLRGVGVRSLQLSFPLIFLLYSSHVLLDLFSRDGRPPFGVPLFWPLSQRYLIVPFLPGIKHSSLDHATIGQVLENIFSLHNLYVVAMETLLLVPLVLIVKLVSGKMTRADQ